MSSFISQKNFKWEYEIFGSENEILFAFHGFGNHSSDFRVFEPTLGTKFKIISFNLPYHGNSTVDEGLPDLSFTKNDLKELFERFIKEHSIEKFSLMGYSLGGKIALQLIELFPDRIKSVFLFAPDGIKNSWSNSFVTKNSLGKKIYQRIINDPSRLFKIAKIFRALKIISPKLSEFVHNQLSTRAKRQLVWDVWMCFRDIKPNIINIQRIINTKKVFIHLFFGKYDNIIPPSVGEKFVKGLNNRNALHALESGHHLVKNKTGEYLKKLLSENNK